MKRGTTKFSVLMGGNGVANLVFTSYYALYLKDFGYSDFKIGIAMMWSMLSCLVCQLAFGYLADKYNCFKQIVLGVFVVATASLPLLFIFSDSPEFVIAFSIMAVGSVLSISGVLDSWVAKMGNVDYGKVRAVSSITYALASIILGRVFAAIGNSSAVYFAVAVFIIVLCAIIALKNPTPIKDVDKMTIGKSFMYLKSNYCFLIVLVGSFLLGISSANHSFLPTLVAKAGGAQPELGVVFFVTAAVEVVVMMSFQKIGKKFGAVHLLTIGFFGFFAKLMALSMSSQVWHIYAACLFQSVSYALVIPATVMFFSEKIDRRYLATALLINGAVMNISQMITTPFFGLLSENSGVNTMYVVSAMPMLLAGIIFMFAQKRLLIKS